MIPATVQAMIEAVHVITQPPIMIKTMVAVVRVVHVTTQPPIMIKGMIEVVHAARRLWACWWAGR